MRVFLDWEVLDSGSLSPDSIANTFQLEVTMGDRVPGGKYLGMSEIFRESH